MTFCRTAKKVASSTKASSTVTSQTYASTKSYHFLQQFIRRTIILFLLCLFVQKFRTSEAMGLKGWTTAGGQDDDASMANQFGKVLPP